MNNEFNKPQKARFRCERPGGSRARELVSSILCIALLLATATAKSGRKNSELRAELASLQKETGLTLAYFGWIIGMVDFGHRSKIGGYDGPGPAIHAQNGDVSPHGTMIAFAWPYDVDASGNPNPHGATSPSAARLAIIRKDGSGLRDFPKITHLDRFCWSPDESKLAVSTMHFRPPWTEGALQIVNLRSGDAEEIRTGPTALTPQCWSPDGSKLVYGIPEDVVHGWAGKIAVYDFRAKTVRIVGRGAHPTWSSDGKWISFLDRDDYYVVPSTGGERKLLLHAPKAMTGLLWSPDSRYVAYGLCCHYTWAAPAVTFWRFYVRRLNDNAEDWVADIGDDPHGVDVHWILPLEEHAMGNPLSPDEPR